MNENDKKAFEAALVQCSERRFTNPQDFQAGWIAATAHRDKQAEPVAQPYAHIYEFDSAVFGTHRSFSPSQWNGMKPTRTVAVYTHPAQPVQPAGAQDAARYEYLEKFTQCIKTPNGDLAWRFQLQRVLVGDTFGKAVDAAIEFEKKREEK